MSGVAGRSGRRPGVNTLTAEARERARLIIEDKKYQEMLLMRAQAGELPPLIEGMLWAYAYGRPQDNVSDDQGPMGRGLAGQTLEQLYNRSLSLGKRLKELERGEDPHKVLNFPALLPVHMNPKDGFPPDLVQAAVDAENAAFGIVDGRSTPVHEETPTTPDTIEGEVIDRDT